MFIPFYYTAKLQKTDKSLTETIKGSGNVLLKGGLLVFKKKKKKKHLQIGFGQAEKPHTAKHSFLNGNIKRTCGEGTKRYDGLRIAGAAGEQRAISIITNYNVQRTDLGTISASLSGRPWGSLDSLDRGGKEGRGEAGWGWGSGVDERGREQAGRGRVR